MSVRLGQSLSDPRHLALFFKRFSCYFLKIRVLLGNLEDALPKISCSVVSCGGGDDENDFRVPQQQTAGSRELLRNSVSEFSQQHYYWTKME